MISPEQYQPVQGDLPPDLMNSPSNGQLYDEAPQSPQEEPKKGSGLRTFLWIIAALIFVFAASFFLRTFVYQSYEIPSASMEDTINIGDLVFAEKVSLNFSEPEYDDIITFTDPEDESRILIKRVIATGGQTVDIKNGSVYVDGVKLDEPYTDGRITTELPMSITGKPIQYPYKVPEGELWVMGDNRTNSQDSRYFGSIPVSTVEGIAVFKYWPLEDVGTL